MVYRLLQAALRQRFLTIVGVVAVALFGLWSFSQLQIEAYPDISDTQVVLILPSSRATRPRRWNSRSPSPSSAR